MNFNNISNFLEIFKNLKPTDTYIQEAFIETVKEVMNVELSKSEIKVQKYTLFLNVHPALKTELYLRKKEILETLGKKLKKETITNFV
jgi:topoisomerase IA-like protein